MISNDSAPLLRSEAEERLKDSQSNGQANAANIELLRLMHELQVHQIELEMQNEELRSAQNALEEARDRYVDLYDFAPVAYLTLTDAGLISEINIAGAALLELDRKQLMQQPFARFVTPEERDRSNSHFSNALQKQETQHFELPLICDSGTMLFVRVDCLQVTDGNNGTSVRVALTDLTERKEIEEVLRPSALKHQLLFEHSRDALMLLSPQSGKFIGANQATLQLFGVSSMDQFITFGPDDFSPERQPDGHPSGDKLLNMISMAMREGSHSYEWTHRRQDGQQFVADVLLTRMELGADIFLQATVRDITKRKTMESNLIESRHLFRELAKKVDVLREDERKHIAREIHDELGQILTALRMDIAVLTLRFGEQNPALLEKARGMTELLDQASRSLHGIVSNLRPTALEMGIVPAVGWLCNDFASRTGCSCVVHTSEYQIDLNEARSVAIFRIVQELLTNVARYADASSVNITLENQANTFRVEVRDDGKGFEPDLAAKGESFGLLGIRERAFALGGDVNIVSAPARGTSVTILIPANLPGEDK